jgi:hypothetical protein
MRTPSFASAAGRTQDERFSSSGLRDYSQVGWITQNAWIVDLLEEAAIAQVVHLLS